MVNLDKHLILSTNGRAETANIVEGQGYRLTMLTDRLLRVEVSPQDIFEDNAT